MEWQELATRLRGEAKPVVLVGMMGSGKSLMAKLLAQRLGIPLLDSDAEIEKAADQTIPEIFQEHGEDFFRNREEKIIARLLDENPISIIAIGGGAFIGEGTRQLLKQRAITVWLWADLDTIWQRIQRKSNRPLLYTDNPRATLAGLIKARYPIYQQADLVIGEDHDDADSKCQKIGLAIYNWLDKKETPALPQQDPLAGCL